MVAPVEPQDQAEGSPKPSISRAAKELKQLSREFWEYLSYLLSLYLDQAKLTATRAVTLAVVGVIGLVVLAGALVFGAGVLVVGLSGLVGQIFGNFWLGATIIGFLTVTLPIAAAFIAMKVINRRAVSAMRAKYAARRLRQKRDFGHDIKEAAHA